MLLSVALLLMASAEPVAAQTEAAPEEKLRCVREEVTGSRVQSRKVCRTQAEWNDIRREEQENIRRQSRVVREGK